MPDLLLELFSEEIPARMQAQAAADLQRLVTGALVERGLTYEGAAAFATPRRLALHVAGLPARQPDAREERKGPRVGAPEAAIKGFLKSAGLASLDQARIETDPKKGQFYVAAIERAGRATIDVLAEILPAILKSFPWPKSMRWGEASARPDTLRWVRPLHSILATFGPETETPEIVRFSVDGIESGNRTYGHRFLAPGAIVVRRFHDYVLALQKAKVVLDPARRRDIILHDTRDLALAHGLELVEDAGLLEEVAGLVEWPVVLMGSFDESYLAIPPEVVRATIRVNQRCFVLRRGQSAVGSRQSDKEQPYCRLPIADCLANRFILVANIETSDHGRAIVAGNERVVAARLADAKFFYEMDLKTKLEARLPKLEQIVFHEKLGTQGARVKRIAALARELAPIVGADPAKAERAAKLAKTDLVTEMVGEFPELQGVMGRYYAAAQGEDASVAAAIEEHYKPQGPNDRTPIDPVSIAVALADKIDTLVGFWAIGEKPTGSKDPYALRRAALGVIRLVLENGIRINLVPPCELALTSALKNEFEKIRKSADEFEDLLERQTRVVPVSTIRHSLSARYAWELLARTGTWSAQSVYANCEQKLDTETIVFDPKVERFFREFFFLDDYCEGSIESVRTRTLKELDPVDHGDRIERWKAGEQFVFSIIRPLVADLLAFFIDRLKVYLRERGARYDLIDAVLAATPAAPSPLVGEGEGGGSRAPSPNPSPQGGGERAPRGGKCAHVQDDLLLITRKVEALGKFLDTDDGRNLLAGFRRAVNILRIEEKKDGAGAYDEPHAPNLLAEPQERELATAIARARAETAERVEREDFEGAMRALSQLRAPVDAFFDRVLVNAEDKALRLNRLRLLNELRSAMLTVADFGKIAGEGAA